MTTPLEVLQGGLAELGRRAKAKEVPDRQLVRALLLALGRLALTEGESGARGRARELREAAEGHGEAWEQALESELSLAVAEHVHSVDPRYLELPSYDFAYTIAARERLEQRLRACELLDWRVPESLLDQVAAADARLAPYLDRGAAQEGD